MVYLNTGAEVKLSTFHFETSSYNLFVIDDPIETHVMFHRFIKHKHESKSLHFYSNN